MKFLIPLPMMPDEFEENTRRPKPSRTNKQIAADLKEARKAYKNARKSRDRFAIRRYLKVVYRVYQAWSETREPRRVTKRAAALSGFRRRSGASTAKTLIDLTCTEPDSKVRSRWAAALRAVSCFDVPSDSFLQFLSDHGGVAGMARRIANHRGQPRREADEVYDFD